MTLDLPALQALWSLGTQSLETARRVLDETGARADDCSTEDTRVLWATIEERIRSRHELDLVTLAHALSEKVDAALIVQLGDFVAPGTESGRLSALREAASRRRLLDAMRTTAENLKRGASLSSLEAELRALPSLVAGIRPRVRSAVGDAAKLVDAAQIAWEAKQGPSLRSGFVDLDAELRLTPNLHAIGAHPGVGKSAFVAGLVQQWTRAGIHVGVLAYEDDGLDLQRRLLACEADLDLSAVSGDRLLNAAEMDAWGQAHRVLETREPLLWLDDEHPRGTVSEACASLRAMAAKGCRAGILDNLSCVRMDGVDERHHAIEAALLELRETALELRMPVIVIGHLKRSMTSADEVTTEPRLSDFAGAAAWERFARSCCGMWRGSDGNPKLVVLKQNSGKVGGRFDVHMRHGAAVVLDVTKLPDEPKTKGREYHR